MASSHSKDGPRANGKIAVVTGINGYIASVLGHDLLSKGYKVRGTVRSRAVGQALADGAYRPFASQFEIVQVSDITAPHAFDEAVKGKWPTAGWKVEWAPSGASLTSSAGPPGAHQIHHVASPANFNLTSVEEVVHVAVDATKNVLQTAHDCAGPQLEAVVVTSSVAAIINESQTPANHVFTEADWNEASVKVLEQANIQPDGIQLYFASKTLAEKAVWSWREEHKPSFSISAVCPSIVLGPRPQLPATPDQLNQTLQPTWAIFSGQDGSLDEFLPVTAVVDVRDVSAIHIWCGEHPAASDGQRYIASGGHYNAQATADILRKHYPARRAIIPEGHPGQGYRPDFRQPPDKFEFDGSKAARAVGLTYIPVEQTIVDTAKALEKYL
ncbi:MAG: hypothetical protein M1826_000905 [Phylliscum demangeonii]|nr:MAG: hypothetical protein M1826_000905 [Phylliscum demangeonii]